MKYLVTSVQYGARVNRQLLENMLAFAKEQGVDNIYTFVQKGRYKEENTLHPLVLDNCELISTTETRLNNNLKLFDSRILPQQINPLTGMSQKLSRDYTHILPSPKIRYLSLASTNTHPRAIMSSGSLTHGNYRLHTAHGRKAEQQHQYGFVFVEIKSNKLFTTHQIEATKTGSFNYLNKKYHTGKVSIEQPEVIVLGDIHVGDTNSKALAKSLEQVEQFNPKRVVLHDFFNGHSINPHEKGDLISELRNFRKKRMNLMSELKMVYREMCRLSKRFPKQQFIVSESNHDIFFERYVRSKAFIDNPENFLFICSIINEIVVGKRPTLEIALSKIGKIPSNFTFLKEDEECRVYGVEIGYHGHRGANGSRGTSSQFSRLNLKMITAHEHSPKLHQNGMVVGTNTNLRLGYTKGATSWMHCNGILYKNGKYMLLPIIL